MNSVHHVFKGHELCTITTMSGAAGTIWLTAVNDYDHGLKIFDHCDHDHDHETDLVNGDP
jgi:hypothetical protein